MGSKELCERYGKTDARRAINAAVRAEIPGGGQILDLLAETHALRETDERWANVWRRLEAARAEAVDAIATRYDLKNRKPEVAS